MTTIDRKYFYLLDVCPGLGSASTILHEDGGLSRRPVFNRPGPKFKSFGGVLVLVNCCRKRHVIRLTPGGQLQFPNHTNMRELEMMAQWGSDVARCWEVKNDWVKTLQDDDASARKRLPKALQEASRLRRDLNIYRDRFYGTVSRELSEAAWPCGEPPYSPLVTWRNGGRCNKRKPGARWTTYGHENLRRRFSDRAQALFHEMSQRTLTEEGQAPHAPGKFRPTLNSWWKEVYRHGIHKATYAGTDQPASIISAMPLATDVDGKPNHCAVLIGVGSNWNGTRQPRWGVAYRENGQWHVVEHNPNPNQTKEKS